MRRVSTLRMTAAAARAPHGGCCVGASNSACVVMACRWATEFTYAGAGPAGGRWPPQGRAGCDRPVKTLDGDWLRGLHEPDLPHCPDVVQALSLPAILNPKDQDHGDWGGAFQDK